MHKFILTLSTASLLFSCSTSEKPKDVEAVISTDSLIEINQPEEIEKGISKQNVVKKNSVLTDSIAELYSGFWLNNDFLKKVDKNKSIYKSKNFKGTLFGFTLDKKKLIEGKTLINGFTVHEGGFSIQVKWFDNLGCFTSTDQIEEHSNLKNLVNIGITENNLIEFQFEDSQSEFYRKVTDDYTELRRTLFEGSYMDSSGLNYLFEADGNLVGFQQKSYFTVLYDFMEGLNFDVIFISDNENRDNEMLYHFKISGDSLNLFEVTGEVPEYEIGELKYTLVKKALVN